jgi:hypothetical protein
MLEALFSAEGGCSDLVKKLYLLPFRKDTGLFFPGGSNSRCDPPIPLTYVQVFIVIFT